VASMGQCAFYPELFNEMGIYLPSQLKTAVAKRRAEFLAGRVLARSAFLELDLLPETIPIGLNRAPVWPTGVQGSISHTKKWCAALVTRQAGHFPGVDIEANLSERAIQSVGDTIMDLSEHTIAETTGLGRTAAMTAVFSGKETLFKALHPITRKYFGFEAARLHALSQRDIFRFSLTRELATNFPKGQMHNINVCFFSGHVLTWCMHVQNQSQLRAQ